MSIFGALSGGMSLLSGLFGSKSSSESTFNKTENQELYSPEILTALNKLMLSSVEGGQFEKGNTAIEGRLGQVEKMAAEPAFDVGAFVKGITDQAKAATDSKLDSTINSLLSATGTSEKGSSMSALLGNKMRGEAAANLAGITAQATATGEQVKTTQQESLSGQVNVLGSRLSQSILELLATGKGAQSKTDSSGTVSTKGKSGGLFG